MAVFKFCVFNKYQVFPFLLILFLLNPLLLSANALNDINHTIIVDIKFSYFYICMKERRSMKKFDWGLKERLNKWCIVNCGPISDRENYSYCLI